MLVIVYALDKEIIESILQIVIGLTGKAITACGQAIASHSRDAVVLGHPLFEMASTVMRMMSL